MTGVISGVAIIYRSSIGKKAVMAITGFILVGFVVIHMLGNLKIYLGDQSLNAYAGFLREVGEPLFPRELLLWIARLVLLASVGLHILMAYQLTRMDTSSRPVGYTTKRTVQASYASMTMRWGGVVLVLFIIYHILHFTLGQVGYAPPGQPGAFMPEDPNNGFNTYQNVVNGFKIWPVAIFYILAMGALGLHLYHGAWSMFQTLGLNNRRYNGFWRGLATVIAVTVVAGNISIPIAVLAGIIQ